MKIKDGMLIDKQEGYFLSVATKESARRNAYAHFRDFAFLRKRIAELESLGDFETAHFCIAQKNKAELNARRLFRFYKFGHI